MPSNTIKSEAYTAEHTTSSFTQFDSYNEDNDVDRFGYKPELQRRFGLWSTIGLSSSIMATWESWLTVSSVTLLNGGKAGSVYSFLYVWIGYSAVVASFAELISMIPTAGGQYHWTYELAPARYRKFISWITGWQVVLAWQAAMASATYLAGTIIQGLAILNWPEYVFKRWHGTLIIWALLLLFMLINVVLVKVLPVLERTILVLHILLFFVVLIPLVHLGPHASAHEVFTDFQSLGGYSDGTAWFVGMVTSAFAFLGADGACHMVEEVRNSRVNVPRALMASLLINGLLAFAIVLTACFTIGDLATALQTTTGFVFIDYFARALRSNAFGTALTTLIIVMFVSGAVSIMASASRTTWAFARDEGLPGSNWLKKVSRSKIPKNAIYFTVAFSFLLSLINIGSAVAFNAIVSLVVASFLASYTIPIGIIAWKRLTKQHITFGPWNLGRYGLAINVVSLAWLALTWVFSFFPVAIPVTPQTMNWSSLIWGVLMGFGVLWYSVYQRHRFTGPAVAQGALNVE